MVWQNGLQFDGNGNLLVAGARNASITIAASNSPNVSGADYVCTGTNDDVTINAAIVALPATGGTVYLRAGTYNLSNPLNIDRSWITLMGECLPMWGGYVRPWQDNASLPTGLIGTACTLLQQTAANTDVIQINNANVPDGGEGRHRGIRISNLYIVGHNYGGWGIKENSGTDFLCIDNNFIQRTAIGIQSASDSGLIFNNSIQDMFGAALYITNAFQLRIMSNLIWDIQGQGMVLTGSRILVTGNLVGDCQTEGIICGAACCNISSNMFGPGATNAIHLQNGATGTAVTGNTIDYSHGGFLSKVRSTAAILCDSGSTANISANTFIPNGTEPAGVYAVDVSAATGCLVTSNFMGAHWNNAGSATNPGTGNTLANNI